MHNTILLMPYVSTFTDAVFTYIVACMWTIGHTTKIKEAFFHQRLHNATPNTWYIEQASVEPFTVSTVSNLHSPSTT